MHDLSTHGVMRLRQIEAKSSKPKSAPVFLPGFPLAVRIADEFLEGWAVSVLSDGLLSAIPTLPMAYVTAAAGQQLLGRPAQSMATVRAALRAWPALFVLTLLAKGPGLLGLAMASLSRNDPSRFGVQVDVAWTDPVAQGWALMISLLLFYAPPLLVNERLTAWRTLREAPALLPERIAVTLGCGLLLAAPAVALHRLGPYLFSLFRDTPQVFFGVPFVRELLLLPHTILRSVMLVKLRARLRV